MHDGPDPSYVPYDQVIGLFGAWARDHPDIFHGENIGRTHAGEPILAARIGRPPSTRAPRPMLLFLGAQHANEALGTNVIMTLMQWLLDGSAADPLAQRAIEGLQCWFVPVVNVDGHRKVFAGGERWQDWRKNGRDNDGDGVITFREDGVDLNRNWDHRWEADLSTNPTKRSYKGPCPFSEPETLAVRNLVQRELPLIVVDYHSPGKITQPNKVFWPWLVREADRLGPDAAAYHDVARDLASKTETEVDGVFYDGDGPAFDTLPKAQSWIYRTTGACAVLVEISRKCWWEGAAVDRITERVAKGSNTLLARALEGPGLAVRVTEEGSGRPLVAEVRVEEHHDPSIGPRLTDARSGAHWRLLLPGRYRVTVRSDGRERETRQIQVREGAWTHWDVCVPP